MTMSPLKVNILIVDDHAVVREGLKYILSKADDLCVIGEAGNVPDGMALLRKHPCDLVLLDLSLPGKSGVELLKMVRDEFPRVRFLILSTYPEDQYAVRVLKQGASGYLTKESAPEQLVTAIRKVAGGGKYISPAMAERLVDEITTDAHHAPHELLSDREFEVFKLIAKGKSLTDIAGGMHVSIKTISTHRARILDKTRFKANADFTRYALQHGLID